MTLLHCGPVGLQFDRLLDSSAAYQIPKWCDISNYLSDLKTGPRWLPDNSSPRLTSSLVLPLSCIWMWFLWTFVKDSLRQYLENSLPGKHPWVICTREQWIDTLLIIVDVDFIPRNLTHALVWIANCWTRNLPSWYFDKVLPVSKLLDQLVTFYGQKLFICQ